MTLKVTWEESTLEKDTEFVARVDLLYARLQSMEIMHDTI